MIATHLCDLIAVTLGATRDGAAIAEGRGIRAARLRAIKNDIEAHLTHADLSPSAVARRQCISESYIRKLFESEGTSFSAFVLVRRLVRAHRLLTARRREDRSIAWIAFACGFGDLSYFNRTFKRLFERDTVRRSICRGAPGNLRRMSGGRLLTALIPRTALRSGPSGSSEPTSAVLIRSPWRRGDGIGSAAIRLSRDSFHWP